MERIKGVFLAKLAMVIAVIFTMLFSSFAPIISWAEEVLDDNGNVIESEYINFDLVWSANNETEISGIEGSKYASFDMQFNTLQTFKDFRITVNTDYTNLMTTSFSNTGEYYGSSSSNTQYLNDIPGGTRLTGGITFNFKRSSDFSVYSRDIVVKLIGVYEKDGEDFNVEITKI